jgi:hypothetical protein
MPSAQQLTLVSTQEIEESDSLYIGRPHFAAMAADSTLFVIDGAARRVVSFDAQLRPGRIYGRAGAGPGEFAGPTTLAFWGDDTLAVMDMAGQAVVLFRRSDAAFVQRLRTPGVARSAVGLSSALVMGTFSAATHTAAGLLRPGDTVVVPSYPLPRRVFENPLAMRAFPLTNVAGHADSVALLFTARSSLYVGTLGSDSLVELRLPSRWRNAIPDSADVVLAPLMQSPERMLLFPTPIWLEWRPDGLLILAYRQFRAREGKLSGSFERADAEVVAAVFITILDRANARACVDLELPTEWAERPTVFIHRDDAYALGHRVESEGTAPLQLRRYALPLTNCEWTPWPAA